MDGDRRPVLAYLDGSEADAAVVAFGAALSAELSCRLILVRTISPHLEPLFVPRDELPHWCSVSALEQTSEALRAAEQDLAQLQKSVRRDNVSRMLLVTRRPSDRLLAWLEGHPVSFLIGASYRRSGALRFVGPTVLDRVAQSGLAQVMTLGFQSAGDRGTSGSAARDPRPRRRARCRRPRRLTRP